MLTYIVCSITTVRTEKNFLKYDLFWAFFSCVHRVLSPSSFTKEQYIFYNHPGSENKNEILMIVKESIVAQMVFVK